MSSKTRRGARAGLALGVALALSGCGGNEKSASGTAESPAADAAPGGSTSADYGGPGRTGVPSDEAGPTGPGGGESTPMAVQVVAVDPRAPSITVVPGDTAPGSPASGRRTLPVQASAAAELAGLKAGDRVTVMCAGAAAGDLSQCRSVVAIVRDAAARGR